MLKETFPYTNIDGDQTVFTAYFNLTRFEVDAEMELEVIQERFQKFQDEVVGNDPNEPKRAMTGPEKRELLGMLKTIIRHAYGERNGDQIDKDDVIWNRFERTGAFSGYLYYLFDNPDKANSFMAGIWPQDAPISQEEAQAEQDRAARKAGMEVVQGDVVEPEFSFLNSLDQYEDDYLLKTSDEEFDAIANHFMQGKNLPFRLIQLGMRRGGATE